MKKFITLSLVLAGFYFNAAAQTAPTATTTAAPPATKMESAKHAKKHAKKHTVKTAAMYECPMKCEKANATAGKCAKCGMDKVALK